MCMLPWDFVRKQAQPVHEKPRTNNKRFHLLDLDYRSRSVHEPIQEHCELRTNFQNFWTMSHAPDREVENMILHLVTVSRLCRNGPCSWWIHALKKKKPNKSKLFLSHKSDVSGICKLSSVCVPRVETFVESCLLTPRTASNSSWGCFWWMQCVTTIIIIPTMMVTMPAAIKLEGGEKYANHKMWKVNAMSGFFFFSNIGKILQKIAILCGTWKSVEITTEEAQTLYLVFLFVFVAGTKSERQILCRGRQAISRRQAKVLWKESKFLFPAQRFRARWHSSSPPRAAGDCMPKHAKVSVLSGSKGSLTKTKIIWGKKDSILSVSCTGCFFLFCQICVMNNFFVSYPAPICALKIPLNIMIAPTTIVVKQTPVFIRVLVHGVSAMTLHLKWEFDHDQMWKFLIIWNDLCMGRAFCFHDSDFDTEKCNLTNLARSQGKELGECTKPNENVSEKNAAVPGRKCAIWRLHLLRTTTSTAQRVLFRVEDCWVLFLFLETVLN